MNEGPCLVLLRGVGLPGRVFPLRTDRTTTTIGSSVEADIVIHAASLQGLHAHIERVGPGAWIYVDDSGREPIISGKRAQSSPLADGASIDITGTRQHAGVSLSFHLDVPAIRAVSATGRWLTFSPWRQYPLMSYAVSVEAGAPLEVRTAIARVAGDRGTLPSGEPLLAQASDLVVTRDIAGVSLADVVARTEALQEGAVLDPRTTFAAAAHAYEHVRVECAGQLGAITADARLLRGVMITWRGELVWLHRPAPADAGFDWSRDLVEDVLRACGCPGPREATVGATGNTIILAQLEQLLDAPFDVDARTVILRFGRAVVGGGHVGRALQQAVTELGAPTPAELAGVVARLFPDEHALDQRTREDAGILGIEGILARVQQSQNTPVTRRRR